MQQEAGEEQSMPVLIGALAHQPLYGLRTLSLIELIA